MKITKHHIFILFVNLIFMAFYSFIFYQRKNYEFLGYVLVSTIAMFLIYKVIKSNNIPIIILWFFTIWNFMHFSGSAIIVFDDILYTYIIYNFSETYSILKYDQVVHFFGLFTTALLGFYLFKNNFEEFELKKLLFITFLFGIGFGVFIEHIEFLITIVLENTSVGGYINTSLDLVFNSLGSLLAVLILYFKNRKKTKHNYF